MPVTPELSSSNELRSHVSALSIEFGFLCLCGLDVGGGASSDSGGGGGGAAWVRCGDLGGVGWSGLMSGIIGSGGGGVCS